MVSCTFVNRIMLNDVRERGKLCITNANITSRYLHTDQMIGTPKVNSTRQAFDYKKSERVT
jgi:hypothetical protein